MYKVDQYVANIRPSLVDAFVKKCWHTLTNSHQVLARRLINFGEKIINFGEKVKFGTMRTCA